MEGSLTNDAGIGLEYGVLFDKNRFRVRSESGGTLIVLYVVNANIERVGTDSDEKIVDSFINRGYVVVVIDYMGNEWAKFPVLDASVQAIRQRVTKGELFEGCEVFSKGVYSEILLVPSGYDVSYGEVYWELDKHGADGSIEKIVEIWNNDFRATRGNTLLLWTDADGKRKATQTAHDGTEPVWLDERGVPSESGSYIALKHTLATNIGDCVKRDGTPIDLKLYMHITFPTNPRKRVPVMCLACSSDDLCSTTGTLDRPHYNRFLFSGYAGVVFDYCYTPMARRDHYAYFDGYPMKGYVTGDNCTYSLKHYNDFADSAAMRYLRYLALSDDRYCFDIDAIGVFGNSKGGWTTHLGTKEPDFLPSRRIFPNHRGEARFENGNGQSAGVMSGAEEQPWQTYNGQSIFGGANLVYSSCGARWYAVTDNFAPLFVACNRRDESCFDVSNSMVNLGRIYSVPTMWTENPQGHTLTNGEDINYGVDAYQLLFDYCGYWLKNEAVKQAGVKVNAYEFPTSLTVRFSGVVEACEANKIIVLDENGQVIEGDLTACYGGVEWTFTPKTPTYSRVRVKIPEDLVGANGKRIANPGEVALDFGDGVVARLDECVVPEHYDRHYIAFEVKNDGSNRVTAYGKNGERIGSVNTHGKGWYRIEADSSLLSLEGVTLRCERACESVTEECELKLADGAVGTNSVIKDGKKAVLVTGFDTVKSFVNNEFYESFATAVNSGSIVKSEPLTSDDVGRRFKISFKVFDTDERYITAYLNHCSSREAGIADYSRVMLNERTRKGEWCEYTLDYIVYEPRYGEIGMQKKQLFINCFSRGCLEAPIYFADLRCTEILSEVEIGEVRLVYENGEKAAMIGCSDIECAKAPWTR